MNEQVDWDGLVLVDMDPKLDDLAVFFSEGDRRGPVAYGHRGADDVEAFYVWLLLEHDGWVLWQLGGLRGWLRWRWRGLDWFGMPAMGA